MEIVGLISGGKDSIYNLLECARLGHRIVALANLYPAPVARADASTTAAAEADGDLPHDIDSYMYQTVGHELIPAVAECLGLPLVRRAITGTAVQQGLQYASPPPAAAAATDPSSARDEVEDLYELLAEVRARWPGVRGVSCGAILSTYQRLRVEAVCTRLGLTPIALLWQREQRQLLSDMVGAGVDAVLLKVASHGLGERQCGQRIATLLPSLLRMGAAYGLNVCGEGGEYESLVLDCPLYSRRLVLDRTVVVRHVGAKGVYLLLCPRDPRDPVTGAPGAAGWHLEDKAPEEAAAARALLAGGAAAPAAPAAPPAPAPAPIPGQGSRATTTTTTTTTTTDADAAVAATATTTDGGSGGLVRMYGNQVHVSGLCAPSTITTTATAATATAADTAAAAAGEMHAILSHLRVLLSSAGCDLSDVLGVHLYLADMALFGAVNAAYCQWFGANPPSRSTVQARMPAVAVAVAAATRSADDSGSGSASGGDSASSVVVRPLVVLDALVHRGSGAAAAANTASSTSSSSGVRLRSCLHVQSISRWAPVSIGPYSQANTLCEGLLICAGQIGMQPATMALIHPTDWRLQLCQALCNAARALACLHASSLPTALCVKVYVAAAHARHAAAIRAVVSAWCVGRQGTAAARNNNSRSGSKSRYCYSSVPAPEPGTSAAAEAAAALEPRRNANGDLTSDSDSDSDDNSDSDSDSGGDGDSEGEQQKEGSGAAAPADTTAAAAAAAAAEEAQEQELLAEESFPLPPQAHGPPPYLQPAAVTALRRAASAAAVAAVLECPAPDRDRDPGLRAAPPLRALLPVHLVVVPGLPRGAAVEVEVLGLAQTALHTLQTTATGGSSGGSSGGAGGSGGGRGKGRSLEAHYRTESLTVPTTPTTTAATTTTAASGIASGVLSSSVHFVPQLAASIWVTAAINYSASSDSSSSDSSDSAITTAAIAAVAVAAAEAAARCCELSRLPLPTAMHARCYYHLPATTATAAATGVDTSAASSAAAEAAVEVEVQMAVRAALDAAFAAPGSSTSTAMCATGATDGSGGSGSSSRNTVGPALTCIPVSALLDAPTTTNTTTATTTASGWGLTLCVVAYDASAIAAALSPSASSSS